MFKLFQHPSLALVKGAGQIMKAMIEEGSAKVAKKIQHGALVVCQTASCLVSCIRDSHDKVNWVYEGGRRIACDYEY
jgi:hypothetical protein